ncbi:hypothetical protein E2C01_044535 [Portunus trituberculatus]|uniref:Uncharacterized protein n=1 Tax=Portunus trituberculatus TaxID=210409 RepID=A0A5B7FZH5_PORTR|nr:hypothetical protein [Portunus trituberculatus]
MNHLKVKERQKRKKQEVVLTRSLSTKAFLLIFKHHELDSCSPFRNSTADRRAPHWISTALPSTTLPPPPPQHHTSTTTTSAQPHLNTNLVREKSLLSYSLSRVSLELLWQLAGGGRRGKQRDRLAVVFPAGMRRNLIICFRQIFTKRSVLEQPENSKGHWDIWKRNVTRTDFNSRAKIPEA